MTVAPSELAPEERPEGRIVRAKLEPWDGERPDPVIVSFPLGAGAPGQARIAASEVPEELPPGSALSVFIDQFDGERFVGSVDKAQRLEVLAKLQRAYKNGETVEGEVVAVVKGGYAVDVGLRAFLPGSQIALRPLKVPEEALGQRLTFKIIRFQHGTAKVVLSRRPLLESDRDHLAQEVRVGAIVEGTIRDLTSNGAWVDVQGLDGFLHVSDMTWGKDQDPKAHVKEGETRRLKVLKFDKKRGKLGLGLRQLQDDRWHDADVRYPAGTRVRGMVVSKTDVGCFIEFEPGLEGLVFSSGHLATPHARETIQKADIGDELDATVVEVNMVARRIVLRLDPPAP